MNVFIITLVPILIIYLSTPVSCCVGNSNLIHPLGEILPSSGKAFTPGSSCMNWVNKNGVWVPRSNALVAPSSKILVPRTKIFPPLLHKHSLFPTMQEGKEYTVFSIFNKKSGAKIYQFLPGGGFKQPPSGGNYFLRHYELYNLYAQNTY